MKLVTLDTSLRNEAFLHRIAMILHRNNQNFVLFYTYQGGDVNEHRLRTISFNEREGIIL